MAFASAFKRLVHGTFLVGLGSLLFGTTLAFSTWLYIINVVRGEVVVVPDLTGLTRQEAEAQLQDFDLLLKVDSGRLVHNKAIPKDHVFLQVPRQGRKIKTGRVVEITLSAGPENKPIPALEGETLSFSKTLLTQADTEAALVSRTPSALSGKGRVLTQIPKPGRPLGLREGVSLLVSDGPPSEWYVMPSLIGKDFSSVQRFLDKYGFRLVTKYKTADTTLGQVILNQIPAAGYPINKSQTITVVVNKDF